MPKVRLALAQTNPVVGDLAANLAGAFDQVRIAAQAGANLVVFGEMAATGYPIEDLAYREGFIAAAETAVKEFAQNLHTEGFGEIRVVLGSITRAENNEHNGWAVAHNSALLIHDGKIQARYHKHHLPNYSVFDEYRSFVPGQSLMSFELNGLKFSTVICEDIWQAGGPVSQLATVHTDVALVLNGSPFEIDKDDRRLQLVNQLATNQDCAVAYVNLVGGQDDLVFDGDSIFANSRGELVYRASKFEPDLTIIDIDSKQAAASTSPSHCAAEELSDIWNALTLGLHDYVEKNGFKSVILGLSGGIDSAVCAAIATDALGADRVFGVSLPSKYSSDHSKSDAFDLAERLGIQIRTETIEDIFTTAQAQLQLSGLAAENLQARIRALILMGLSNQEGHLVLTTGNKTELAVGYSTIYGDSVGGFAPIKDVPKTMVWDLARWRNKVAVEGAAQAPIPENSITKPPSAELRPGQVDQDSLPEYEVLDEILELFLGQRLSSSEIIRHGFEADVVTKVLNLVDRAEWKRRQGAIGPKISSQSFGRERRVPITNRYKP
ncbi:MAG: NAD+ synthase [Micrococcales bacterium]